jgi:hypothetical protein
MQKVKITEQYLALSFQEIYRQVIDDQKYRYRLVPKDFVCLSNFIKTLSKHYQLITLADDFINNYIQFQVQYWSNLRNVRTYEKYIPIAWIFGDKAFKRYLARGTYKQIYFDENKIVKFKSSSKSSEKLLPPSIHEEVPKDQVSNDKQRLDWCIVTTTLYHPLSDICKVCVCQEKCKDLLKEDYPESYKKRINVN